MFGQNLEEDIIKMCEGNPGALNIILNIISNPRLPGKSVVALDKCFQNKITGSKLYMLWNDCCNRDTDKMIDIILNNTVENLNKHINYENGRGIEFKEDN